MDVGVRNFLARVLIILALLAPGIGFSQVQLGNDATPGTLSNKDVSSATNKFGIISGTVPITIGTSLYPIYQAFAQANLTTVASSTAFSCNSSCGNVYAGANISNVGAYAGTNAFVVTWDGVSTGTTNIAATSNFTGTFGVGWARWDSNSAAIVNTLGAKNGYFGPAAQNNSTWTDQYEPNACSTPLCAIAPSGSNTAGAYFASRTSDLAASTGKETTHFLAVNDKQTGNNTIWGQYLQCEALVGTAGLTFCVENSLGNFVTTVQVDPYTYQTNGATINQRLDCGYGTGPTYTNCSVAMDIINNGAAYETGINFRSTALDTGVLTHPPAISMPAGANGYSFAWYKATGYSTPAWQEYATNTTTNGNTIALNDASWVVGGAHNWATIGQTAINFGNTTDNPTFAFQGTGTVLVTGNVSAAGYTPTSSTIATSPRLYLPSSGILGLGGSGALWGSFQSSGELFNNAVLMPGLASNSAATTGTVCWTTGTGNLNVDTTTTCLLSDSRLKMNVSPLEVGIDEVMKLNPVSYDLKPEVNPSHLGRQVGLIAQDVMAVDPRLAAVYETGPDVGTPKGVRYEQMVALLVKAMQEQQHRIDRQQLEIYALALLLALSFGFTFCRTRH